MKTLTLTLRSGHAAGTSRVIDGTTQFSIGTGAGNTWRLTAELSAMQGDAFVRSDNDQFLIEGFGHVSVNGQSLNVGAELPLHQGAEIEIGPHLLTAHIAQADVMPNLSGGADAYRDTTQPTISAILSDVSPGGDAASGPLPGRTGEEWLDSFTAAPNRSRPDWDRLGAYGGDSSASDPLVPNPAFTNPFGANTSDPFDTSHKMLPDDWNVPASDTANRAEQGAPNRQSVNMNQTDHRPDPVQSQPDARILREAAGLYDGEVDAPDEIQLANAGTALAATLAGLAEMERNLNRILNDFDVTPQTAQARDQVTMDPGAILSDLQGDICLGLSRRIDATLARQTAVFETLLATITHARDRLDPDNIRAAVASKSAMSERLRPKAAAWDENMRRWTEDNSPLNLGTLRETLAANIEDTREDI
ncbi:hypothetical protein [Yoonia maritima]|uniref:hypothetical protein n=1 Tax=Yoonia maritima TaxID=1435347 RepID=UPI000D112EAC|nr:hypothetical protein [Yoonia maritima]